MRVAHHLTPVLALAFLPSFGAGDPAGSGSAGPSGAHQLHQRRGVVTAGKRGRLGGRHSQLPAHDR